MRLLTGLMLAFCIFVPTSLQGQGIMFVEQETRGGKTAENEIRIDKNYMRRESTATGEHLEVFFDGAKQSAMMINFNKKTYFELTKADASQKRQTSNVSRP